MKLTREITNVIENYNEIANKMNEYLVREIIYEKNQRKNVQNGIFLIYYYTRMTFIRRM